MKKFRPPNEATRDGSEPTNQLMRSRSWQHFSRMCGPANFVRRRQLHMMYPPCSGEMFSLPSIAISLPSFPESSSSFALR